MNAPELGVIDGGRPDLLDPPEHLEEEGRACWNRMIDELVQDGIIDQVDLSLVEQAAEMYEGRRQAQVAVRKHGQIIQGRKGMKKNPAVSKHLEYAREYRQVMKAVIRQKEQAVPRDYDDDDPYDF